MVESSQEKKKIFYMVVLILTLIIMLIGASLAYLKLVSSQKPEGTVLYTGTLEINYIDGIYIKDPILYPLNNVDYNTYNNVYRNNFAIRSSGTLDQNIKVDLIVTKNEFPANALGYVIYNNKGNEISRGNVPNSGKVTMIDNTYLASKDTANYTLIIWLKNTGYNQNDIMGNIISGRIDVNAVQIKY